MLYAMTSKLNLLNNLRIVLCQTSHPGNIGSTARAMKTMGLTQLVLVDPQALPEIVPHGSAVREEFKTFN